MFLPAASQKNWIQDKLVFAVAVISVFILLLSLPAFAQQQQQPQKPNLPNDTVMDLLIRSTLLALNNANVTGNYTVLRDLGAPNFQFSNSAAKLTMSFTELRARKIDLSAIILIKPRLVRKPEILENGLLRLTGFLPTQPEQVNFDLLYQAVGNRWRLFGLGVNLSPAQSVASAQQGNTSKPTSASANNSKVKKKPEVKAKKQAASKEKKK